MTVEDVTHGGGVYAAPPALGRLQRVAASDPAASRGIWLRGALPWRLETAPSGEENAMFRHTTE
ncbi:MAG: hypothetical protein KAR22_18875, partial [Gammaproteobacteria bacterium]|nr:hypothetical protein [Gammaproteobacteria bacterium]